MINSITLKNFRKFKNITLNTNKNLVIIVGKNAVGKTTILESIYLTSRLKSPRTNNLLDLIKENEQFAYVNINARHKYEVVLSDKHKMLKLDNVEYKKASEFVGKIQTILFSPQDLNLILGSPSVRRKFMDMELSMLNKKFLQTLSKTNFYLKQRNELLKNNNIDLTMLKVITSSFIESESLIIKSRLKFLNLLNEKINLVHKEINKDEFIKLQYIPSFSLEKASDIYNENIERDKILKTTSIGFHRDDFKILLNDLDATHFASQGQIRNIAISIKIALVMVYEEYLGVSPILLLDDLFSELDESRQKNIIKFLENRPQTFISTTTLKGYEQLLDKALVIKL